MQQTLPLPSLLNALRLSPPVQALLALVLLLGLGAALVPREAPLTQLQLRGNFQRLAPEDVSHAAAPFLDASFFGADVQAIRDAVAALPWVSRVRVERIWPGALAVHVWEREPYARWNEHAMLDTESQAYTPRASEIPSGLPQLGGVSGTEAQVAQGWQRLALPLMQTPLQLTGLSVDARGEWTARAANGVELRLGQGEPERHVATLLGPVPKKLQGRWAEVKVIDLRYTNGFAVSWRVADASEGQKP